MRSASVLGMVGAGRIGMVLWKLIRGFQFGQTFAVMPLIIGAVSIADLASAKIRKVVI